jgi:hypothetical protein
LAIVLGAIVEAVYIGFWNDPDVFGLLGGTITWAILFFGLLGFVSVAATRRRTPKLSN